jgi:LysR family transcriptional activator of nhaA
VSDWLNYHHLHYFWTVAREGGVTRAAAALRLRPSTVSAQIRRLEEGLGAALFAREGRRLVLTDAGRTVLGYADSIFALGRELTDTMKGRRSPSGLRLLVGIADAVPKIVAHRLLAPALSIAEPIRVVCREGRHDRLLAALAVHELDVVLSDAPVGAGLGVRAFHHLLGECGVSFFAAPPIADGLRGAFPGCLDGAPILLPTEESALRRSLEGWMEQQGVGPRTVGEFEDNALLMVFGRAAAGVFASPSVVEQDVARQHGVRVLGRTDEIRERFYVISAERRLRHPAVVALTEAARERLFG